jgi:hypothetical protein
MCDIKYKFYTRNFSNIQRDLVFVLAYLSLLVIISNTTGTAHLRPIHT